MSTPWLARPSLEIPNPSAPLARLYDGALDNLATNTVPGRRDSEPQRFLRAGGGYQEPWTRDAAINAWNAASILEPVVARDTLLMVCDRQDDGTRIIAQDNQWWDQIIWVVAAWHHYLVTGDHAFAVEAFQIARDSVAVLDAQRYRPAVHLYAGPAVMQDGISGYPSPPADQTNPSSFVLDHPGTERLLCLSTNALSVGALRALAALAEVAGTEVAGAEVARAEVAGAEVAGTEVARAEVAGAEVARAEPSPFARRADAVAQALNDHFWLDGAGRYGFFLPDDTAPPSSLDTHHEALGSAFVTLFGVADPPKRRLVLANTHREPFGVVNVWPHFADRFSDTKPGRHNVMCWPMVMGMFGDAAARAGDLERFDESLADLERLVAGSGGHFFELYDATTGVVDGGWQRGTRWESEPDQTWSATALLRLVHHGLFGLRYCSSGLAFEPVVPNRLAGATLRQFPYRRARLDLRVAGSGTTLARVVVDGRVAAGPVHLDAGLSGDHTVVLELAE